MFMDRAVDMKTGMMQTVPASVVIAMLAGVLCGIVTVTANGAMQIVSVAIDTMYENCPATTSGRPGRRKSRSSSPKRPYWRRSPASRCIRACLRWGRYRECRRWRKS